MPIFWRYMIVRHLRIMGMTLSLFLLLLLVIKSHDVMKFASLGSSFSEIIRFIFCLIPLILPVVLPITSLVAALLIGQAMSTHHELVVLRACGLSIKKIFSPLATVGIVLSLIALLLVGQAVPAAKQASRELLDISTLNPLLLFQKNHRIKNIDYSIRMEAGEDEKSAKWILLAAHNQLSSENLLLLWGKELLFSPQGLSAKNVVSIHSEKNPFADQSHDLLAIDFMEEAIIPKQTTELLVRQHLPPMDEPYFGWDTLTLDPFWQKKASLLEIVRRLCLALSPLTFTRLGFFLSIHFERKISIKSMILLLALGFFATISFLIGKNDTTSLPLSLAFYIGPHLLIFGFTEYRCFALEKGCSCL